jgi:cytidine deaminase
LEQRLLETALSALERSHAPYSGFCVGAAILADNGRIYGGCNVENAAYPEGICAETAAIAAMVIDGGKRIVEIAVAGRQGGVLTPCGGCRQRIREFAGGDALVHSCGPQGLIRTYTLGELLPHAFGPGHLT